MPTDDRIELVRSLYAAFARRDFEAIAAALDEEIDVRMEAPVPWGGRYTGLAGFQDFFGLLLAHLDTEVEIGELIDAGAHVVQLGYTHGRVLRTGAEFRVREMHVWGFAEGKVRTFHIYLDVPALLAVLPANVVSGR